MIGGKNNALHRAYLAGLQAQTSVYGATIPVYYGCTRGNMLLTWAANLRNGAGLQSNKKGKKKGVPNFVENVDFLLGHNPLAGVLQFWYNNSKIPLNFVKYTTTLANPVLNSNKQITIPDANFYFVVGVTANIDYNVTFNDYGAQGSRTLTGTFEMPLWNLNYAGPDPTSQNGYRQFPAVYQWIPYSGPTINFPGYAVYGIPNYSGFPGSATVNVYYAQLDPGGFRFAGKNKSGVSPVPATALRLTWEPVLGGGTEYSDAGLSVQQILYPPYAGVESSDYDMGASGVAPAVLPEVMGSFPVWSRGDADFADMIEDIFKSGPAQAGTGAAVAYGDIHHGLGCLEFPGTVQKKIVYGGVEPFLSQVTFDLPNTAGNFLFCFLNEFQFGDTVGISDTASNAWHGLFPAGHSTNLWYAIANAAQSDTITFTGIERNMDVALLEVAGLDTIDSAPTSSSGTGPTTYTATVTTTNKPGEDALILSFIRFDPGQGPIPPPPLHWTRIVTGADQGSGGTIAIDQRRTKFPGTYSISYAIPFGANFRAQIIALKNSQPNSFTSPLGNILDDTTMQQTRLQCRAYGLSGSLVMDAQKKASDWLTELYRVGNAAPVWSGFVLKSIPYAEQSMAGNGAIYTSPTASGPIANLVESDFVADESNPPVDVDRSAQVDAPNLQQIQCPNRDSDYNQTITAQPDNGSMSLYGTRKETPKTFMSIQTSVVARAILGIMVREANIIRNTYKFTAKAKWSLLEAMDVISIPVQSTMPAVSPQNPVSGTIAVRLLSVVVDDKFGVKCEAEPFIFGLRTPQALAVTTPQPYQPALGADPGSINPPIIFESTPALDGVTNPGELWIVTSGGTSITTVQIASGGTGFHVGDTLQVNGGGGGGPNFAVLTVSSVDGGGAITGVTITNPGSGYANGTGIGLTVLTGTGSGSPTVNITVAGSNYGGCVAYVSIDGGASYQPVPASNLGTNQTNGVIQGNGTQGYTAYNWPAAASPDTTNDLPVDLVESNGVLNSYTPAVEDSLVHPCFVGGEGGPIPTFLVGATQSFGPDPPAASGTSPSVLTITAPLGNPFVSGDLGYIIVRYRGANIDVWGPFDATGLTGTPQTTWRAAVGNSVGIGGLQWIGLFSAGHLLVEPAGYTTPIPDTSAVINIADPAATAYDLEITGFVIRGGVPVQINTAAESGSFPANFTIFGNQNKNTFSQTVSDAWRIVFFMFGSSLPLNTTPLNVVYVTPATSTSWGALPAGWANAFSPDTIAELASAQGFRFNYELMAYGVANLTAPSNYTLKATGAGNHLDRGVDGAPNWGGAPQGGPDHFSGSPFAWLDPNNSGAAGILRVAMANQWINRTLYFKFIAFNSLGGGLQSLADVPAYVYCPPLPSVIFGGTNPGSPTGANPAGVTPGVFLVNGT